MKSLCALMVCTFCPALVCAATPVTCSSPSPTAGAKIEYFVSVAEHDAHRLHVAIRYHDKKAANFAMPVWNALYQVRDFSQYVTELRATDAHGQPMAVTALDKTTWQIAASDGCAVLEYSDFANVPGPFSAEANAEHVFVNWAQVLMHAVGDREAAVSVVVRDVPAEWSLHDLGRFDETRREGEYRLAKPIPYDQLVDSPVEMSASQGFAFDSDGAHYRVFVHAEAADYDQAALQEALQKVVHAEVEWMGDRPFGQYTILYHFPHAPIGGGMEHSFGTAIAVPAERLKDNSLAPIGTTAHEFFHLWNVKRIRSQAMEPVDYEHEQYTRSLWFAEGVTSTAAELMLVRAGLESEAAYRARVGELIADFEEHPARRFQSPEASSLEAWMEGRDYYRRAERSVSYYESGEILGMLLDLKIREATQGKKSLRDLFQYLDAEYAKKGRYYDDVRGLQQAAEKVAGANLQTFFNGYVSGTAAIPYNEFFRVVGLKLEPTSVPVADAGFDASVNFTGLPEVTAVNPGGALDAAGVRVGDTLATIDGRAYSGDLGSYLSQRKPGEVVSFAFKGSRGALKEVKVTLGSKDETSYQLVDLPEVGVEQRAQRAAWMRGDDLGAQR